MTSPLLLYYLSSAVQTRVQFWLMKVHRLKRFKNHCTTRKVHKRLATGVVLCPDYLYPDLHECLQLCKQMWILMHESSRHTLATDTQWGVVVYLVHKYTTTPKPCETACMHWLSAVYVLLSQTHWYSLHHSVKYWNSISNSAYNSCQLPQSSKTSVMVQKPYIIQVGNLSRCHSTFTHNWSAAFTYYVQSLYCVDSEVRSRKCICWSYKLYQEEWS